MPKHHVLQLICFSTLLLLITHTSMAHNPGDIDIDHLTIVVSDLEQAKKDFKDLGFTIKPGRVHANSIENAHVKFQDGTALELITATQPKDAWAEKYMELMASGDGPAFLCLRTDDPQLTKEMLHDFNPTLTNGSYYQWLTFAENSVLSYLFFMKYANPPLDKKEDLQHQNGTEGIKSLNLFKEDYSSELSMFQALEADINPSSETIKLGRHKLFLELRKNRQNTNHPVASITLFVEDIHETMEQLPKGIPFNISINNSIILPREYCHGIQIVFEQKE